MTFHSEIDGARLTVLLDIRYPQAYLALNPVLALGRESGIEINWLPLQVPPLKVPSTPAPGDDRGVRHRRNRAQAIAREIQIYADADELVMRDYYRDEDPTAVHLAWLWVRDRQPKQLGDFLCEAFRAYWALELDPSSVEAVTALLDSLGGEGSEFLDWCAGKGAVHVAALAEDLRARGLSGVPCYLLEDEAFLGRQHLPMIRWILDGRRGPGPI